MPPSLCADSNKPGRRRKRSSSSRVRGDLLLGVLVRRESLSTLEPKARVVRPYTPSLPDDSSDPDVALDPLRNDSDSHCLKDAMGGSSVHQVKTPVPMPWTNISPVTPDSDSLASSVVKGNEGTSEVNVVRGTLF